MAETQLLRFFYKKNNEIFEFASNFESLYNETCKILSRMLESYELIEKMGIGSFHVDTVGIISKWMDYYIEINENNSSIENSNAFKEKLSQDLLKSDILSNKNKFNLSNKDQLINKESLLNKQSENKNEKIDINQSSKKKIWSGNDFIKDFDSENHLNFIQQLPQVLINLQTDFQFQIQTLQSKLILSQINKLESILDKLTSIQLQVENHYVKNMDNLHTYARKKDNFGVIRYVCRFLELINLICVGYLKEVEEKSFILKNLDKKIFELAEKRYKEKINDMENYSEDPQSFINVNNNCDEQIDNQLELKPIHQGEKTYFFNDIIQTLQKDFNSFTEFHHLNREWVNELVNLKWIKKD